MSSAGTEGAVTRDVRGVGCLRKLPDRSIPWAGRDFAAKATIKGLRHYNSPHDLAPEKRLSKCDNCFSVNLTTKGAILEIGWPLLVSRSLDAGRVGQGGQPCDSPNVTSTCSTSDGMMHQDTTAQTNKRFNDVRVITAARVGSNVIVLHGACC